VKRSGIAKRFVWETGLNALAKVRTHLLPLFPLKLVRKLTFVCCCS
jgi:hypothetical protein